MWSDSDWTSTLRKSKKNPEFKISPNPPTLPPLSPWLTHCAQITKMSAGFWWVLQRNFFYESGFSIGVEWENRLRYFKLKISFFLSNPNVHVHVVFSHLAKNYYFLTNEWTVFDHVTALGQSSETISTLGSVSSYPAQIVTRTSWDFHHGQDAGH